MVLMITTHIARNQDTLANQDLMLDNSFDVLCSDDKKLDGEALSEDLGALEVYASMYVDAISPPKTTLDVDASAVTPNMLEASASDDVRPSELVGGSTEKQLNMNTFHQPATSLHSAEFDK